MDERMRGVMLRRLDVTALVDAVRRRPDVGAEDTVRIGYEPYAMAEADGRMYVVCGEGVGWEVTDAVPLVVPVYVSSPGRMALVAQHAFDLSPAQVSGLATGDEVDLADLVRRFGGRLESNFWTWHQRLMGAAMSERKS